MTIRESVQHCIENNGGTFDIYPGHIRQSEYDRQDFRPKDVHPESWDARLADLRTFVPVSLGDGASIMRPVHPLDDLAYCRLEPVNCDSGYFVSIRGLESRVQNLEPDTLAVYLRCRANTMNWSAMLGVWLTDGTWYLDMSVHTETLERALWLGAFHKQEAIWDCATKEVVRL